VSLNRCQPSALVARRDPRDAERAGNHDERRTPWDHQSQREYNGCGGDMSARENARQCEPALD
jgi:hypothetical protein